MLLCLACLAVILSVAAGQDEELRVQGWHEKNVKLATEMARDLRMTVARKDLDQRLADTKLALDLELARADWEVCLTGALSQLSAMEHPQAGNWSQYSNDLSNKVYCYTNACQQAMQEYYQQTAQYRGSSSYYDRTNEFSQDLQSAMNRLRGGGGGGEVGPGAGAPVIAELAPVYLEVEPSAKEVAARQAYEQSLTAAWQAYEQALADKRKAYKQAAKAATDAHNAGQQTRDELISSLRKAGRVYETDILDLYDNLRSTAMKELRKYQLLAEE